MAPRSSFAFTRAVSQTLVGILDRRPAVELGEGVGRHPVRRAGGEEGLLVREVAVDSRAAHAGVERFGLRFPGEQI